MDTIWKVYIPSNLSLVSNTPDSLLMGWVDSINYNVIIVSNQDNAITITMDDNKRTSLLKKIESVNKNQEKKHNFEFAVIGSMNIAKSNCLDLLNIYNKQSIWLQFTRRLKLEQIFSFKFKNINKYYIIQYHATNSNIFSPYYTLIGSSYDTILHLCNHSDNIYKYLHHNNNNHDDDSSNTTSSSSSCFIYLLLSYFKLINIIYGVIYLIIYVYSPFSLFMHGISKEISMNNDKFGKIIGRGIVSF